MIKNHPLFDDVAKFASGAAGSILELRREVEALVSNKMEQIASKMDLVSRKEFEIVQQMAAKALEQNEKLIREIENLKNNRS